jgi:hypothetical protein
MKSTEIARVQSYLRRILGNNGLSIQAPERKGQPVEVLVNGEFLGTIYRDEEDGEISYDLRISILEEDLPAA